MSVSGLDLLRKATRKIYRKIERRVNQAKRYEYPSEGDYVRRYGEPVIEGSESVFDPYVVRDETGYRMYYSDRAMGAIRTAFSLDGVRWSGDSLSLAGSGDSSKWDCIVNRACVLKLDNEFLMWFTGQGGGVTAIGVAKSDDGVEFTRISNMPVVAGVPGCEAVMNPCVLRSDGGFRMWFAAGEAYEPDVILYAESADGVDWDIDAIEPVLRRGREKYDCAKVGGCDVLALPNQPGYFMFYIGYQNVDVGRICTAWSSDGIKDWKRYVGNPILSPRIGAWDADSIYKPAVQIDVFSGGYMLWYNGRKATSEKIGLAMIDSDSGLLDPENYQ